MQPQPRRALALDGIVVAALLFAAALGIRVYRITDPPLEFHPTRQYRAAMIARAQYVPYNRTMPDWARDIALENGEQGALEPPIMETIAVYGYRLLGGEHLWVGRLISIVGWLIGGLAIWLVARRVGSPAGTLVATAVYLLAPFGVLASRSFQPDALMTGATAVAILQIVRFADSKSRPRLAMAILATAVVALIKPVSLFFTFGCFVAVEWLAERPGALPRGPAARMRQILLAWDGWAFVLLATAPTVAYYAYGVFVTGAMQEETGGRFLPHLILTRFFWSGWWSQATTVADLWVWLLAAIGISTAMRGLPRRLLTGLCCGYLLYGFVFTYHIATHDYYHLPALIIASLGAGAAITRIERVVAHSTSQRLAEAGAALVVLLAAAVWLQRSEGKLRRADGSAEVATYQRIGEMVQHSQRTVLLADYYGSPLRYHGQVAGAGWPSADDLLAATMGAGAGAAEGSPWSSNVASEQRYREFYQPREPEYFVVTDFGSFDAQPDLAQFLDASFLRLDDDGTYRIYDLRKKPVVEVTGHK